MSSYSWGFILLKLIGLYLLLEVVYGVIGMAALVSDLDVPGLSSPVLLVSQFASILVTAAFSGACLFLTKTLADWLFPHLPEHDIRAQYAIDPREVLAVGMSLLGIYLVASNVSAVVGFVGELVWYLEGSRQDFVPDFWTATWRGSVPKIGSVVVGGILCVQSRQLSAFLLKRWENQADGGSSADGEAS